MFMQGGVADLSSNAISITDGGALQAAGLVTGDKILSVNGDATDSYRKSRRLLARRRQMQQLLKL